MHFYNSSLEVRMAFSAPLAVITAAYSSRLSRMLLWHTDTDKFVGSQWLQGRISPLDVSADGRHFAYAAETFFRVPNSYMVVSRPPFFTAVAFRPCLHVARHDVFFSANGGEMDWYCESRVLPESEHVTTRIEPGSPFRINDQPFEMRPWERLDCYWKDREQQRSGVKESLMAYGSRAFELMLDCTCVKDLVRSDLPGPFDNLTSATWDHRGRLVICHDWQVLASSAPFREWKVIADLRERNFGAVPTPDWAKTWTDMPPQ